MNKYFSWLQKFPPRLRLIGTLALGVIFFVLVIFALWQECLADNLARYAPARTGWYLHISLPQLHQSAGLNQLAEKILGDYRLNGVPLSDLDREMALVGWLDNGQLKNVLLLRTAWPGRTENFLRQKEVPYKFLNRQTIAVGDNALLGVLSTTGRSPEQLKNQKKLFSSLDLYLSREAALTLGDDWSQLGWKLFARGDNLSLSFKATDQGLKLISPRVGRWATVPTEWQDFDLVLAGKNFCNQIKQWEKFLAVSDSAISDSWQKTLALYLGRYQFSLSGELAQKICSGQYLIAYKNNPGNQPDLYAYFALSAPLNDAETGELENALKSILAWRFPAEKSVILADGTRLVEYRPDPRQFAFTASSSALVAASADSSWFIAYQASDRALAVSSRQDWLAYAPPEGQFALLNRDLLAGPLVDYLSGFRGLEASREGIILK